MIKRNLITWSYFVTWNILIYKPTIVFNSMCFLVETEHVPHIVDLGLNADCNLNFFTSLLWITGIVIKVKAGNSKSLKTILYYEILLKPPQLWWMIDKTDCLSDVVFLRFAIRFLQIFKADTYNLINLIHPVDHAGDVKSFNILDCAIYHIELLIHKYQLLFLNRVVNMQLIHLKI